MRAVVVVRGGVLEAVYSNNPPPEVVLVDHDDLASLEHDPEVPEGLAQVY